MKKLVILLAIVVASGILSGCKIVLVDRQYSYYKRNPYEGKIGYHVVIHDNDNFRHDLERHRRNEFKRKYYKERICPPPRIVRYETEVIYLNGKKIKRKRAVYDNPPCYERIRRRE